MKTTEIEDTCEIFQPVRVGERENIHLAREVGVPQKVGNGHFEGVSSNWRNSNRDDNDTDDREETCREAPQTTRARARARASSTTHATSMDHFKHAFSDNMYLFILTCFA